MSNLYAESRLSGEGSYQVDLGITLSDGRVVTAIGGFLLKQVGFAMNITDVKLPVSLDPSVTMEAYTNTSGNYRMIGVPTGVGLTLQASKTGYQSSGLRPVDPLTQGETAEENFALNPGASAIASIWINPSPSVNLQTGQTVQFSGTARDDANNVISPTPGFTWLSSNPAVVSINTSGLASALGSGAVTIEASNSGITSQKVTVRVGGLPAAPSNFTAVAASYSQINLAWQDNSSDEDGFKIERGTNGITYTLIATQYPNVTSYNDTGLSANTQYYYRIWASNANGDSSKASATATTPSIPVPTGPSGLVVTPIDANTINLGWTDNSDNETGFQIRRSLDGDVYNVITTTGANATIYQNSGLTQNTYYYYRVYAYNGSGNSTTYASGFAQTPDTIPSAPSGLAASTISSSQINLTWTDNSNNESGFKIERSPNGVDTWTEVYTTTSNTVSYPNTGLTYNTTYYYRIRSYNTAGNSNYTTIVFATTNQAAPSAPTGAGVTVLSDTSIRLNWTDASNNEDGFKVERSPEGITYTLRGTFPAGTAVFTDTGLSALTAYWYRVYAYNGVGNSGYSNVVSGTTQAPPVPAAPTTLVTTTVTSSSIGLQWTDNSTNEDGFKLERSVDGVNYTVTYTLGAGVNIFSDTPLTPSTTFYYRVYAYNLGGNSGYATANATTLATPNNLAFAVQPANTTAGATMASIQVQVRDVSNNPLPLAGIPVTVASNKNTLNGTLTRNTNGSGIAIFNDLYITTADTAYTFSASSSGLTPATSNTFDITPAAANNLAWVTHPANSVAGQTMAAFTVRVRDIYNNNVQGTTVSITTTNPTLAVYQGGTPVAAYATANSDANGIATFSTISMTVSGSGYIFRASSGALPTTDSSGFNITTAAVNNLAFIQQPTTTSAGATMSPPVTVRVRDAYNNFIAGAAVSITTTNGTLINGTLTQNSSSTGIATFSPLSMTAAAVGYVLSATCGAAVTTSNPFDITAEAANLSFIQQPTNTPAGATITAVTVKAQDQFSNPQVGVTVSITVTNGTLMAGTLSISTTADGTATFSNLSISLAGQNYALSASASSYTTIVSSLFDITPSTANNLTFSAQPANTTAGATMPAVQVTVRDQYNNLVPSVAVSLTTTTQLNGTTTASSNAVGVVAFNDLFITTTGTYQLSARAGAIGPTNSNNFDITPATVSTVTVSGADNLTSGGASEAYTAVSKDVYNNTVTETYNWSHSNGTGSVTRTANTLDGFLVGTAVITATGASSGVAGNKTVTVNPGSPNILTFVQQPSTATVSVNISPAVTVRVQDINGNLLSGVAVSATTTDGTLLSGTLNRNSVGTGIATFDDLSIAAQGSYSLYATTGLITATSVSFTILPTLPSAPSGLTATAISPTAISLTWTDNANNESGFRIERFISGSWQEIYAAGANAVTYTNNGLTGNTFYNYRVRAYNAAGNSGYSNEASATTPMAPPAAPTNLVTNTVTASSIALEWVDNATNEEGFKLERSTNGTTYNLRTTPAPDAGSFNDTGLTENTTYWYRIYAFNSGGNSGYAGPISVTTLLPLPSAPSGLNATAASSSQINLNWADNSSNESGFKLERSDNGGATYPTTYTLSAGATTYSNTGLNPATTYYYRVLAYNATGNSSYSNVISATTFEVPPVTPTNLTISATLYNSVTLTWTDTSNNETGFKLERKTGAGSFGQIATPTANATTYTDNTVSANTNYTYRIRAYNEAGNSNYSNEANTTTPLPAKPTAPTGLITTTVTSSSIGLQWTDNAGNEDGFKIERSISGAAFSYLDQVSVNITVYTNTGLASGNNYAYRVYAWNAGGNSGYSNVISATTPVVPPNAPSNLITTTVTSNSIGLQWQDNSNDETSFKVERSVTETAVDNYVWVANQGSNNVTRIKKSDFTTTTIAVGSGPMGLTVDETYCWVVNSGTNYVSRILKLNPAISTTITVGNGPRSVAVDGTYVWVGNTSDSTVTRILKSNPAITTTIAVGANPSGVAVDDTYVWVSSSGVNYVTRIKKSDLTTTQIGVGSNFGGGVAVDETYCWVTIGNSNNVIRIKKSDSTTTSITVGIGPIGVAVDETYCWVTNYDSNNVTRIKKSDLTTTTISGGYNNPRGVAVDGTYCWVANYSTNNNIIRIKKSDLTTTTIAVGSYPYSLGDMTGFAYDNLIFSQIAEVGSGTITFNNTGLSPTTTYWYRVRAYNTAGNSGYSNVISGTTLAPPPPNAPSNLTATPQNINNIQLNWQDNSGDETEFRVYRSTDGVSYTRIATTTANSTIYYDTTVSPSITYWYRVTAYNANGESSYASATGIISVQPDAMVRTDSEPNDWLYYATNNMYESTPVSQTRSQGVERYKTVTYYIRVQNDGNINEAFWVTGTGSYMSWTVTYYDEWGWDITWSMTSVSGYMTTTLSPSNYTTIRMEVGQSWAETGSYYDATVMVKSNSDPSKVDTIKTRNEAIPSYYSISGIINYPGTSTGRTYINVNWENGGQTNNGTSIPVTGSFTIRGVQPGNYTLSAWMDNIGYGVRNAVNPKGNSGPVNVVNGDITGVYIYLSDQTPPSPVSPTDVAAFPADSSALIFFSGPQDMYDQEIADSYRVYWHTSISVSKFSYLGYKTVPVSRDEAFFVDGLVNGSQLYFVMTAWQGAMESAESAVFGPALIGNTTGNWSVSGAISYPGVFPTGPLYVGIYNDMGAITCTRIAFPGNGSQAYTLAGVANGSYVVWSVLDMNGNGMIDNGDYKETENGLNIVVNNGNLTGQNLALPTGNGIARVETGHWKKGATENYDVEFKVRHGIKQVVAVAALSGPGVITPIDIGNDDWEYRCELKRGSSRPGLSDEYAFEVTYSDLLTETLIADVSGVLDSFAQSLSPTGTGGHVIPTFTWAAPASPPPSYTYHLRISPAPYGGQIWWYPEGQGMPSTQLSVLYNVDSGAKQPNLNIGTTYIWYVSVRDANGNQAAEEVEYSPTYFDNQPDAMIGLPSDPITSYLTDNLYESYPMSQVISANALNNMVVSYLIRVQNEGAGNDRFTVIGGSGNANWAVTYYDGPTGGTNITALVTGPGYSTPIIPSEGYVTLRVEVTPTAAPSGESLMTTISTFSQNDQSRWDYVRATTNVPQPWNKIAAGSSHTAAIKSDGTLWVWGANWNGQLGLGDTNSRSTPTRLGYESSWKSVAAGYGHTMAIKNDGSLWAWGYNWYGQLGLNDTSDRNYPTQVGFDYNWQSVACGYAHTIAIKGDGTLWTWGDNSFGQLGHNDTAYRYTPTQVTTVTPVNDWNMASAGNSFTLLKKVGGTIWSCGFGDSGRLGLGNTSNYWIPTKIGTDTTWISIAAGQFHGLACKSDNSLWVWGANWSGQLGLNDTNNRVSPTQILGYGSDWLSIAGGESHSLATKMDGSLWAWGSNWAGQLGLNDTNQRSTPTKVGPDYNWFNVAAGFNHSLSFRSGSSIWLWGNNGSWQLGLGNDWNNRLSPVWLGQ
ncbi:MAG: fibronectin type III domain-containing protein [Planctomycetota bacterium]